MMAYRSIRFFLVGALVTSCSGATTATPSNDGGTSDAGSSSSGSDAGSSSSNDPPASPCSALHTPVPSTNGGSSGGFSATLTLLPGNLVTAAAGMPIGARENEVPPDYGPPSIDGVVLELRDCATNTVIPSTVSITSPGAPSYVGNIVLTPNAPLPEAWYQLAVTAVPERIVAPAPISFHTGSHPLVTGLSYCAKAAGIVRAAVIFSEPVTGTGNAVKLEQDGKVCTYVDGIPGSAVTVECRGFADDAPVHLKVSEGLASQRGIAVTFETTIDLAKLTEESGCLAWRRQ